MGFCPMSHGEPGDLCMVDAFSFEAPDRRCPAMSEHTHKPLERDTNGVLRTALAKATALKNS
jgi:hypothetical protein